MIDEKQQELIEEFAFFDEWMQKYEHIIELGKDLPILAEEEKKEDLLIPGCQSRVWLKAVLSEEGKVNFFADSDAIISKGVIAMMVRVFDNETPADIVSADLEFLDTIGLKEHLSQSRSNGLASMVKQIKLYATVFQAQLSK